MVETTKLSENAEDCLEAIYVIGKSKKVVRVKNIAKHLNTKMASVVVGLKSLAERGLVEHEHYGYVELTLAGEEIAKKILYRHKLLFKFFREVLALPLDIAEIDACRIEHYLSDEGLERVLKFIEFIESCPEGGPVWLTNFYYYLQYGKYPKICLEKAKRLFIPLEQLDFKTKGEILTLGGRVGLKQDLVEKGILPGAIVSVEEKTPKGIKVKVGKMVIFLAPDEAKEVFVTQI
jgi:DtxR family Mn-dependent transcriptional regulator